MSVKKCLSVILLSTLSCVALTATASMKPAPSKSDSKKDEQKLRAEFAEPFTTIQTAIEEKRYPDVLTQLDELQAKYTDLSPYESYVLNRFRANAEVGSGNYSAAVKTYGALLDSEQFPAEERLQTLDVVARLSYTAKDYPQAIAWIRKYRDAGGDKELTLSLLPQALYVTEQYGEAARELEKFIAKLEAAGQQPTQQQLQLLASCALKQKDMPAYMSALKHMVAYYPTHDYWQDLILRTANQPSFSRALDLDVYRLRMQTGTLDGASDYMEAAQLALQAGLPGEAQNFVNEGYKRGLLGKGIPGDVQRQARLKELAARKVAEDRRTLAESGRLAKAQGGGDALVATGYDYVSYKEFDTGIDLMRQGIAKGSLKNPGAAQFHLAYAQWLAGDVSGAQATLQQVRGADGSRELADLLLIVTRSKKP